MHACRYCKTAICNLSCSIQDPQFLDNEMKRVQKKGKGCWIKNPSDELKVKCHKCQELFRGRDLKAHIESKQSSLIITSSIKCFDCEYEAVNLEKSKINAKVHYSNVNRMHHGKCKECMKVFGRKFELKEQIQSVHNGNCDVCLNVFGSKFKFKERINSVHNEKYKECMKMFESQFKLMEHMNSVHNKKRNQCSGNSSLFANNSQIDSLQIYSLIFRSQIDSYSYLPQFHVMNIIPICEYYNLMNIIPLHEYFFEICMNTSHRTNIIPIPICKF